MDSPLTQTYDGLSPIIESFERAWQSGQPPSIADFLPPLTDGNGSALAIARREILLELTLVDFEFRWKLADQFDAAAGDCSFVPSASKLPLRPRTEDYLHAHPELLTGELPPVNLLAQEYYVRHRWGDHPSHDEFTSRYPALAMELRTRLVQVDGQLWECQSSPSNPSSPSEISLQSNVIDDGMQRLNEVIDGPELSGEQAAAVQHIGAAAATAELPPSIGRYQVERLLGKGGFGYVYLAYDGGVGRQVAIKIPSPERIKERINIDAYLNEARAVGQLPRHPHIVQVFDVGSDKQHPVYVVFEYIQGTDLRTRLKASRLSPMEAARLVAPIAEALAHAHERGLYHRDIKPENILIDSSGQPYVMDFGLALREEDFGKGFGRYAGTPPYMSPEQVRGEGHRIDGRSDLFSLGVMFYELLTGRMPFRGQGDPELIKQITSGHPKPPRQSDSRIPKELERICLKCLEKRVHDRYSTGIDLAGDLRDFLVTLSGPAAQGLVAAAKPADGSPDAGSVAETVDLQSPPPPTPGSDERPLRIVPKGLRSFDEHDADFFLELLPGVRDRDGLPESIRFWKQRIEETDTDKTFAVGLIYGPSGCGKSSLVKAGLLPRLSRHVIPVYVEATAAETESRLLHGLRKHCPALPTDLDLVATVAALRRGQGLPSGRKVLLVLDQFEQWLHAKKEQENTELVQALRHCDGAHVQCIVMVRDDFWMAVTRFLTELEVELLQGKNFAAADLFEPRHARKVLTAFGQAFGVLPENLSDLTTDQQDFVTHAVAGLTQEGKVICVRLALFAEMMKGKPWTPVTLKEVGGTEGVGVTFLEETFSSPSASPKHRLHQKAARAVLKALLPGSGTDIKGHMRSQDELRAASGYADRQRDFDDLLRILDSEIRLITPTDPEGKEEHSASSLKVGQKYYQLTHDYLVPSLRDWLTRKQRETRRGRAELRLAERAGAYSAKPESRFLPSWWEWPNILVFTRRKSWTATERRVMGAAGRHHGVRLAGLAAVLSLAAWLGLDFWQRAEQRRANTLAEAVISTSAEGVPFALDNLRPLGRLAIPRLQQELNDPQAESAHRLHAAYALADLGEPPLDALLTAIEQAPPTAPAAQCRNIVTALRAAKESALLEIARRAAVATSPLVKARYAIVALQLDDAQLARESLTLRENPIHRTTLIHAFAGWHGDLAVVADLLRKSVSADPLPLRERVAAQPPGEGEAAFRSGLCAALGTIPWENIPAAERDVVGRTLVQLYTQAPDRGTHSAAGWALSSWKQELPAIATTAQPPEGRQWHVNGQGMPMLAIPAGTVTFTKTNPQTGQRFATETTISRSFLLADREVTVEQFLRFVDDGEYPAAEKPVGWKETYERSKNYSPASDGPANCVNWFDAVLYCNWLSAQEGIQPAYERTGEKWKWKDHQSQDQEADAWRCDFKSSGYRLPTETEWEYACRAMTTSKFCIGDEEDLLTQYGWIVNNSKSHAWACGVKQPNSWGLFDMHGNLWEWCDDLFYPGEVSENNINRVLRGGAINSDASYAASAYRYLLPPAYRNYLYGFRPARTYP